MGFKKRATTTGKVIIPEGARKEVELIYLYDIVAKIETYNIPYQIAFNMDQTPSKYNIIIIIIIIIALFILG